MDLEILRAELTADPLGRGYAGMTDQEVADAINDLTRSKLVPIPSSTLLAWAGGGADDAAGKLSRFERIETLRSTHPSGAIRGICKTAYLLISRDGTWLDLSLPDRQQMVGALVAGQVLTQDEVDQLYVMAAEPISRATELGIGVVGDGHIRSVRGE